MNEMDTGMPAKFAAAINNETSFESSKLREPKGKRKILVKQEITAELARAKVLRAYIESFLPRDYKLDIPEYQLVSWRFWAGIIVVAIVATIIMAATGSIVVLILGEEKARVFTPMLIPIIIAAGAHALIVSCLAMFFVSKPHPIFCTEENIQVVRQSRSLLEEQLKKLNAHLQDVMPMFEKFWQWDDFLWYKLDARIKLTTRKPYHWQVELHYYEDSKQRVKVFDLNMTNRGYRGFVHAIIALNSWTKSAGQDIAVFEEEMLRPQEVQTEETEEVKETEKPETENQKEEEEA